MKSREKVIPKGKVMLSTVLANPMDVLNGGGGKSCEQVYCHTLLSVGPVKHHQVDKGGKLRLHHSLASGSLLWTLITFASKSRRLFVFR